MRGYTPEFLAKLRHQVEADPRPLRIIAKDFGIGERTLYRIAEREGFVRLPRGLPPGFGAREEMRALLTAPAANDDGEKLSAAPDASPPSITSTDGEDSQRSAIERISLLVQKELAAAEMMRAQLRIGACEPIDAERMARTLSTLTQTFQTLQRLRAGEVTHNHDDDIPTDIDAFRFDLARRIEAFVASRAEPADAGGDRPGETLGGVRT